MVVGYQSKVGGRENERGRVRCSPSHSRFLNDARAYARAARKRGGTSALTTRVPQLCKGRG
eukprot:8481040-Prorocentrum_lima.AAC.1